MVEGHVTYCDGRWLNIKQHGGLGNTPAFRPQVTKVTIIHEPTA